MTLDLHVFYRALAKAESDVRGALEFELPSNFSLMSEGGWTVEAHGSSGDVEFSVICGIERLSAEARKEHSASLTQRALLTRLKGADMLLRINTNAAGWTAAVRLASATAEKASGLVYDPSEGRWMSWKEARALLEPSDSDLNEDSPEVEAVYARLADRCAQGFRGGPAGIHIVHAGSSSNAEAILQFALVNVADIDEGDAFTMAINCPLRILDEQIDVEEAQEIAADLCSIGIDARVLKDAKSSKAKGHRGPPEF